MRRPLRQCGAKSCMGRSRARKVSAASARMGVSQSTVKGGARRGAVGGWLAVPPGGSASRCKAPSQTARVLPAPVLACSRPLRPSAMACQTVR